MSLRELLLLFTRVITQRYKQLLLNFHLVILQHWVSYAMACLKPGIDYFVQHFGNDATSPLSAFKAARHFPPLRFPVAADVDALSNFSFLNEPPIITSLKSEL